MGEALEAFIKAEKLPAFTEFSQDTSQAIFGSGINHQVCVCVCVCVVGFRFFLCPGGSPAANTGCCWCGCGGRGGGGREGGGQPAACAPLRLLGVASPLPAAGWLWGRPPGAARPALRAAAARPPPLHRSHPARRIPPPLRLCSRLPPTRRRNTCSLPQPAHPPTINPLPCFLPSLLSSPPLQVIVTAPGEMFAKGADLFNALVEASGKLKGKVVMVTAKVGAPLAPRCWRAGARLAAGAPVAPRRAFTPVCCCCCCCCCCYFAAMQGPAAARPLSPRLPVA